MKFTWQPERKNKIHTLKQIIEMWSFRDAEWRQREVKTSINNITVNS